ncbi:hypothetical protein BDFG_02865 [Blastomyces dermatitidis ATCC 26199]|nr:hypothetical protein BDFG_02865 [Blastomyces dermatitidis ATCC 26199]
MECEKEDRSGSRLILKPFPPTHSRLILYPLAKSRKRRIAWLYQTWIGFFMIGVSKSSQDLSRRQPPVS